MSEDEEEGAKEWDLFPAIDLLRIDSTNSTAVASEESSSTVGLADSALARPAPNPEDVPKAKSENGSQEVSRGEDGIAVVGKERVLEDPPAADANAVAEPADQRRFLKTLLLDTLARHSPERTRYFSHALQHYDLDNPFRYPPTRTEAGVPPGEPRTAPPTPFPYSHSPLEPLGLISNGVSVTQYPQSPPGNLGLFSNEVSVPQYPQSPPENLGLFSNGVPVPQYPQSPPGNPGLFSNGVPVPQYPQSPPGNLGFFSNGVPLPQSFPATPGLITYEPLRHSPPGSGLMAISHLPAPPPKEILPWGKRSAADRKRDLVTKLMKMFPQEAKSLLRLPGGQNKPAGASNEIHVFVDCSNILIGFFDTLKTSRGIPLKAHTRRVPFAFHSFTIILERGRPVAKRILVGSTGLMPTVSEVERCGYETSILDRVMKNREPALRPRANGNTKGNSGRSSEGASGPQRMVEQAVDEVLHLKILESIVDAKTPSTIVLASGDGAEAEYSAGFTKMVERALEKGWKVELVSFAKNMSSTYRNLSFTKKWKKKFSIILLDAFAEELLDM